MTGGTINLSGADVLAGVRMETSNATYGDASLSGTLTLDGVTIQNAPTGIGVDDNSATNVGTVTLNLINHVQINGGGLVLNGADVRLAGNTLGDTAFSGAGNYITLAGGALGGLRRRKSTPRRRRSTADRGAQAVGLAGDYAIEDKISDYLDSGAVGFVRITPNTVYVAQSSENTGSAAGGNPTRRECRR